MKTKTPNIRSDVLHRALIRFDENTVETLHDRAISLEDRRFVFIEGAQWDGDWGEQFENSIKVQVNKTQRGHDKIINDYRANRFTVNFRPVGDDGDDDTAELLNGLLYADVYRSSGQLAFDNAFGEGVSGGMGAWRLCNEYEDESDPDNDHQRINIEIITDADQRVFFDRASKLYDKSDARFAFVLNPMTPDAFEEEYGAHRENSWPEGVVRYNFDWYTSEVIWVAEYYEVEHVTRDLHIYRRDLTDEEFRYWAEDMAEGQGQDLIKRGFTKRVRKIKRKRIHKWLLSGSEVLEDCGFIAGDRIPIVPYFGKRVFIDNIERFKGHVRDAKDGQRVYNSQVSKLVEMSSLSPREVPIFAPEQVEGLQNHWENMNIERHPYGLAYPVLDPISGAIVQTGPIGYVKPPDVPPVTAQILQLTGNDIAEITNGDDGSMEIKSNVSGEAMDIAASRVDQKSYIYMDNFKLSMKAFGEVYKGMAKEVYVEEGRVVEKMDEEGNTSNATLGELHTDPVSKTTRKRHDLSVGRFNVIADVTEATATRRDKTVRTMLTFAEAAVTAQAVDIAAAALIVAGENMDGEGIDNFQEFLHQKGVAIGVNKPTPEEQAAAQAAAEEAGPDAQQILLLSQAKALEAQATKFAADAEKTVADTEQSRAKTVDILASAQKKTAETEQIDATPPPTPDVENVNSLMRSAA